MGEGRSVLVAVMAMSLGMLACSLPGIAGDVQEVQEQVEAVQDMAEKLEEQAAPADAAQEESESQQGQDDAPESGALPGGECPVLTSADVEAATGSSVMFATSAPTSEALHCSFALEGEVFFQLTVMDGRSGGSVADEYQSLLNNAIGEGHEVDGPWEAGMFFPATGLIFRTSTNVVWINMQDQAAAVQVGSAVAAHLPYSPEG